MPTKMKSKRKIGIAALFTALTLGTAFVADRWGFLNAQLKEIKPKENISVYLDMELLSNGKSTLKPEMEGIIGKASSFIYGPREGNSGLKLTALTYQVEGMSSQEIIIDFKITRENIDPLKRTLITSATVKARNRVKSTILVEQDEVSQESLQLLVTPYFGPIKKEVVVK